MKTRIISNDDELTKASDEMEAIGYKFAAISTIGLPPGKLRITFLSGTEFKDE